MKGLTKGGRAAVIIPEGVLFGTSTAHKKIRQELIDKHKLEAVISMPAGVFKPYAGVNTGILIFTKTTTGGTDKVWFYEMQADGLSLDDKRTELVKTGENGEMRFPEDFGDTPDIINRWKNKIKEETRSRTDKSFFVAVDEIKSNNYDLTINRYKDVIYEQKQYDKPDEIISQIKLLDKERSGAIKTLEELLK